MLTVTELPYLSWALSIKLRKHRDMRLSDCPKWDLAKISEGPEEPSTLTGSDLRLAVEMGGTAVWIPAGPTVSPQAVLNLTACFSFRNKSRPSSSWIPPGGFSD